MTAQGFQSTEARKGRLIDVLTDRYARGELPMEEYERLVADIHRAKEGAELGVVADIVAGSRGGTGNSGSVTDRGSFSVGSENIQNDSAMFTERRHAGAWLRKRNVAAITCLASQVFDFRDVSLPAGETLLEVFAFLGSVEVIVPEGLAVRMEVVAHAGDASASRGIETREREGSPVLVIAGSVVLGSVAVKMR
jgi:hypothetical protein